jgi:hypothetical protein
MNPTVAIALVTSVLAALAFYASSPQCLWTSIRRWRKLALLASAIFCAVSIALWIAALGIGVGLCAMLGVCMLTLALMPWLALLTRASNANNTAEHD